LLPTTYAARARGYVTWQGELEQIQFLLGHASVETTERYLGCKQRLSNAVNDNLGLGRPESGHCPKPTLRYQFHFSFGGGVQGDFRTKGLWREWPEQKAALRARAQDQPLSSKPAQAIILKCD
jgi:hypothetical protein